MSRSACFVSRVKHMTRLSNINDTVISNKLPWISSQQWFITQNWSQYFSSLKKCRTYSQHRRYISSATKPSIEPHPVIVRPKSGETTTSAEDSHFHLCPTENYQIRVSSSCWAQRLLDQQHIEAAQHLLYRVYVQECGWEFAVTNPTGFQVKKKNGRLCLTDRFDKSAVWIGAFHNSDLVSVIRILSRQHGLPLDIEGYTASRKKKIAEKLAINHVVECQRCVTEQAYRGRGLNCLTIGVVGKILIPRRIPVIVTSPAPFFSSAGQVLDRQFDYGDGIKTKCIFYDKEDMVKLARSISLKMGNISI